MSPPFRRLLIANRGEIAIRIARACRELGIESVAVYSDADVDALHPEMADLAVRIGPPGATESYLSIPALLDAARRTGAEAIHPGYGFLSENADFARAVGDAGLVWIGPPADTQAALGNKLAARRSVAAAGVPIVPGLVVPFDAGGRTEVDGIGYPVMLKAAAGGGGRGMRRVERPADLDGAVEAARAEAAGAFGDETLYVERLVEPARHVEVQLLGDRFGTLACLGERECSVQRRNQKLVEETPSPAVTEQIRERLLASARRVAGTVDFHSLATVEFLLDSEGRHYFLEMNTRLQVEHGITELVTGVDLVVWQIRVAAGEALTTEVTDAMARGHAIEVRLYAEDPFNGFRPVGGAVTAWRLPQGPGVRVDAAVKPGLALTPEYDPLLAKVMVWAVDRPAALARLRRALDETLVGGVQTDLAFQRWVVDDPGFAAGVYDTGLIADRWRDGPPLTPEETALVVLAAREARAAGDPPVGGQLASAVTGHDSAWARSARAEALRRR